MKKLGGIYGESYKKQPGDDSIDKLRMINERRDQTRQLKMVQMELILIEEKKENDRLRRRLREAEQKLRDAEQEKRILEQQKRGLERTRS